MKDCSIQLTNHPGDLSRVAQALARRGVNIKALAAISTGGGVAVARILPDDITVARSALEAAHIRFTEGEVHLVLLENKADPKLSNKNGLTALSVAAGVSWSDKIKGSDSEALEAVKLCAELGLDVDAAMDNGDSALHGAALRGVDSIVKFLVEKGAKLDAETKAGLTPLDIAMGKVPTGAPRDPHPTTVTLIKELGGKPGEPKKPEEKKAEQK